MAGLRKAVAALATAGLTFAGLGVAASPAAHADVTTVVYIDGQPYTETFTAVGGVATLVLTLVSDLTTGGGGKPKGCTPTATHISVTTPTAHPLFGIGYETYHWTGTGEASVAGCPNDTVTVSNVRLSDVALNGQGITTYGQPVGATGPAPTIATLANLWVQYPGIAALPTVEHKVSISASGSYTDPVTGVHSIGTVCLSEDYFPTPSGPLVIGTNSSHSGSC